VDYVAQAIHLSSLRSETVGRVFHLCSGPEKAPPLSELAEKLRAIYESHGHGVRRLRCLPRSLFKLFLPCVTAFLPRKVRRSARNLPYFLTYLNENQDFDNSRTQAFLGEAGIHTPAIGDYLRPVMERYLERSSA
jgi:hypothetical protein